MQENSSSCISVFDRINKLYEHYYMNTISAKQRMVSFTMESLVLVATSQKIYLNGPCSSSVVFPHAFSTNF